MVEVLNASTSVRARIWSAHLPIQHLLHAYVLRCWMVSSAVLAPTRCRQKAGTMPAKVSRTLAASSESMPLESTSAQLRAF